MSVEVRLPSAGALANSVGCVCADVRETHRLVVQHIASCRKIPGLEDCTVVLVLESNLAYEAQVRLPCITLIDTDRSTHSLVR